MPPAVSKPGENAGEDPMRLGSLIRANLANLSSNIDRTMKALAERRDGLLLAAGGLYLLGYLSWALYGVVNGIGSIPVLDAQYFAAGVVPALLVCLFFIAIRMLRAVKVWLKYPPTPRQVFMGKLLLVAATLGIVSFFALSLLLGKSKPPSLSAIMIGAGMCIYLSALVHRNRGDKFLQGILMVALRIYAFLGLLLWGVYVERLMPLVPIEWGGARARCVLLDLDSAHISPAARRRLFGEGEALSAQGVLRSVPLHLIYDGSEYFFLLEQAGRPSAKTNPVFRLRKEAVKGVFPCKS